MQPRRIHAAILLAITLGALPCPVPGSHAGAGKAPAAQQNASVLGATRVTVTGRRLLVNGQPFQVRGVGYAPTPIGDDVRYDWPYGDYFTAEHAAIYSRDLPLLRDMGANTVRLWGWKYDSPEHGPFLDAAHNGGSRPIYVIVSYWLGAGRDIHSPAGRQAIVDEFTQMVAIHKDHPAVLMWAIGNELNASWMYGDSDDLFSLIDEMAAAAHAEEGESYHPVTTPLCDGPSPTSLIDTIAARDPQVPNLDVWSVQVYRGPSFGSLFVDYAAVSGKPLAITEYGIDAYDMAHGTEYELIGTPYQATYAEALWKEIAANPEVCAGGAIMAYSDEWWKGANGAEPPGGGCPEGDAGFHSVCGYTNLAHPDGFSNEEWWGIVRPVKNGDSPDIMQKRAAYHRLRSLWTSSVYVPCVMRQ
ncbi:MAG TPA: glycoside hydrolase family 2 TIM barrel-domain containing protein [Anaerolineae bacterium]|nr:glycoside hydrolase family 2 TIM barrel-domain containing protein [Anaerolineae bacterium]